MAGGPQDAKHWPQPSLLPATRRSWTPPPDRRTIGATRRAGDPPTSRRVVAERPTARFESPSPSPQPRDSTWPTRQRRPTDRRDHRGNSAGLETRPTSRRVVQSGQPAEVRAPSPSPAAKRLHMANTAAPPHRSADHRGNSAGLETRPTSRRVVQSGQPAEVRIAITIASSQETPHGQHGSAAPPIGGPSGQLGGPGDPRRRVVRSGLDLSCDDGAT